MLSLKLFFSFLIRRIFLILFFFRKRFFKTFFLSLGLFIILFFLILFIEISQSVKQILLLKIRHENSPTSLIVKGTLSKKKSKEYEVNSISYKKYKKVLSFPEVHSITYSRFLNMPAKASIQLSPPLSYIKSFQAIERVQFDIILEGVQKKTVQKYLTCMKNFQTESFFDEKTQIKYPIIPILIPQRYLEIINLLSITNQINIFKTKDILGLNLKIKLGESTLSKNFVNTQKKTIYGKICGFLPDEFVTLAGIPIDFVSKQHKELGIHKDNKYFQKLFVNIHSMELSNQVKQKIEKLKLNVITPISSYKSITIWTKRINIIFLFISFILIILGSINIINTFTLKIIQQRQELGLYLIFGASFSFIFFTLFLEGLLWGIIYSTLAIISVKIVFYLYQDWIINIPLLQSPIFGDLLQNLTLSISTQDAIIFIMCSALLAGASTLLASLFIITRENLIKEKT